MRTIIIDKELQPYMAVTQGKTHNNTRVVVLGTITVEDLKQYDEGSVKWFVDELSTDSFRYAFSYCDSLTEITLPKELPMLSDASGMFSCCTCLTEIILPKKLPMLWSAKGMFSRCTSLSKVTMSKEVYDKFHKGMFEGIDESNIEFIFH